MWEVREEEEQQDGRGVGEFWPELVGRNWLWMQEEGKIMLEKGGVRRKEGQVWNFEKQLCWNWRWAKDEEYTKRSNRAIRKVKVP